MKSVIFPATLEAMEEALLLIDRILEEGGFSEEDRRLTAISAEELYTNVASYAYEEQGEVEVSWERTEDAVTIRLRDWGKPFDPFSRKDPKLGLPIEEMPIGGLGIYMVKQFMDRASYVWEDGCNITEIVKYKKKKGV